MRPPLSVSENRNPKIEKHSGASEARRQQRLAQNFSPKIQIRVSCEGRPAHSRAGLDNRRENLSMPTFTKRPKAIQPDTFAASTLRGRANARHSRESNPVLDSGRAAVKFEENARGVERASADGGRALFDHDLSRIPLHASAAGAIQTKLAVNSPGDSYEQEADRVADKLTGASETSPRGACACGATCPECSGRRDARERIQTKPARGHQAGETAAPPSVEKTISSRGEPLDPAALAFFEPRFGRDFGHVRVHTDASAAESAEDVNARAYTLGSHIVFKQREYAPRSREGLRLLAHELTHVVQQGAHAPALIQRESPPPGSTNYAFDTYRVTGSHLSDPDIIARFKALSFKELLSYRGRVSDPDVIAFIEQLLDEQLKQRTLDQLSADLAAEKDPVVKNFIAEWISSHAPTSYEFAVGANKPGATATAMTANGISVKVVPDEFVDDAAFKAIVDRLSGGKGSAHTKGITVFDPKWHPHWVVTSGKVTSVRPTTQTLTLKTVYPRGTFRTTQSGYGVGTRQVEDVDTGRSTLAHHEGEHALCFVRHVQGNAPPVFGGAVGDTDAQVKAKAQTFETAMAAYYANMATLCGNAIDCTGIKASFCP